MLAFAMILCSIAHATAATPVLNGAEHTKSLNPNETYNKIIFTMTSSLSAFGSVAIIVTYFLWRDLRSTTRRILVYISIGDFFATYPSLIIFWTKGYQINSFPCRLQSFITSTAIMWSFFWTTSLAIYLYIALVKRRQDLSEKLMLTFHVVNWCLPILLVGGAWYEGRLGHTNSKSTAGWCWILIDKKEHKKAVIWMLICGKFWEIISYFVNGFLYFYITLKIKKEVLERMHLTSTNSVMIAERGRGKLTLVPLIFVVLRIWGTIRFLLFAFSADPPYLFKKIMLTLQLVGDNAQGITNFILFCVFTEKFKQQIIRVFRICNRRSQAGRLPERGIRTTFSEDTRDNYKSYS